jgi:hypothetical protein
METILYLNDGSLTPEMYALANPDIFVWIMTEAQATHEQSIPEYIPLSNGEPPIQTA